MDDNGIKAINNTTIMVEIAINLKKKLVLWWMHNTAEDFKL